MTCIAWDGKTLAADKQGSLHDIRVRVTKIRKLDNGELVATTGSFAAGGILVDWYIAGADPAKWPECQKDDNLWTHLVIIREGKIYEYERLPFAIEIEESFYAWGSGREPALGALAMGADAREAVEVACRYCICCGMGVDSFTP